MDMDICFKIIDSETPNKNHTKAINVFIMVVMGNRK